MKKVSILILIFLLQYIFSSSLNAQKRLYLRVNTGNESTFSKFENRKKIPSYIKRTTAFDVNAAYGLGLFLDLNKNYAVSLDYCLWGAIGSGIFGASHSDSAIGKSERIKLVRRPVNRWVITGHRKLGNIKIDFSETLFSHLFNKKVFYTAFDIELLLGLSYELILPTTEVNSSLQVINSGSGGILANDIISVVKNDIMVNRYGWGIRTGLNCQFYNRRGHRSFQIGLLYHQGLNRRIVTIWQTAVNGVRYPDFNTVTRGSMMSVYVGMPIRLLTFGGEPPRF